MSTHTHANRKNNKHATSHFDGLIDNAEALVAATADIGEDKLGSLRTSLSKELEMARDQLERVESKVASRVKGVNEYVHENPWQMIGAAAAAGVVLGAIAFRK